MDALYWEYKYNNGEAKNFVCPGGDEAVGPCPVAPSDRNILYENRLLGVPRQVLIKSDKAKMKLTFSCQAETASCSQWIL